LERNYTIRQKIGLFLGIPLFIIICSLPSLSGMPREAHLSAAIAVLMATFWITEAIPIPATSLIPLVLFPLLKIQNVSEVAVSYGNSNIFLFMGGFFIAQAMQKCNLHRRIALYIIERIGTNKRKVVLGFMLSTAFLSMWISDTATALMMLPIALAVIVSFEDIDKNAFGEAIPKKSSFGTALMLGVAYSASIGGIGTLVGTPPNIIFAALSKTLFPNSPGISFAYWLVVGLPVVIIMIPIAWYYLVSFGLKVKKEKVKKRYTVIDEKIKELGPMKFNEKLVLGIFIFTALGWIFRENIEIGALKIPGWSDLLGIREYTHDSMVAIFSAILLFLIPVNLNKREFLLDWEHAKRIPWGILVLFGGGIALASGFKESGLSNYIGESLQFISGLNHYLIVVIVCVVAIFLTEITSNTATTNIFMPIMASLAVFLNVHPYILMIPATISMSLAFMLPVATPPLAIVFSSGYIEISDMIKVGFILNIIGCILIPLLLYFVIFPILGISPDILPQWAV